MSIDLVSGAKISDCRVSWESEMVAHIKLEALQLLLSPISPFSTTSIPLRVQRPIIGKTIVSSVGYDDVI